MVENFRKCVLNSGSGGERFVMHERSKPVEKPTWIGCMFPVVYMDARTVEVEGFSLDQRKNQW